MDYSHNASFIIAIAVMGAMFGVLFTAVAFALFRRPKLLEPDKPSPEPPDTPDTPSGP